MNRSYIFLLILTGAIFLAACEKTIDLQPEKQPAKLVVDGEIEEGEMPIVVLSNSLGYFSTADLGTLLNAFVHNARVSISDGTDSVLLKEYIGPLGAPFFYYSVDTTLPVSFRGRRGKTYTLRIETNGQMYKAMTSIPAHGKTIDSLWWKPLPRIADTPYVSVIAKITDPPGLGDYIRYFVKINPYPFLPPFNSTYDDQITDGKTYDIPLNEGFDRGTDRTNQHAFMRGDTVLIKHCNTDKATYDFWRTWEFAYSSTGNPFSSPGMVIGNISNGALGAFCGYSVQYKALIIPK
jgi:hypothetical protein